MRIKTIDQKNACLFIKKRPDPWVSILAVRGSTEMGALLITVGGIFFIGALAASIAAYLNDRDRRNGKGRSLIIYAVGALLAGVLACALFIPAFFVMCSGEACAWVGAIVVLPGLFALGVTIFVYFWLRHGKSPNPSFKRDALKRAP